MRLILLLLFLAAPLFSADVMKEKTHIYPVKEYRVVDGDTIEAVLDIQFGLTKKTYIRINGINTPEVRGDEKRAGLAVKSLVEQWSKSNGKLYCKVIKADKYGGRYVGEIITESDDKLSDYLIDNKLADKYDGKTKKKKFSDKELDTIENTAYNLLLEEMELKD